MWERAKKLNGDRASSVGRTAMDAMQATKAGLLPTSMDVPNPGFFRPEGSRVS